MIHLDYSIVYQIVLFVVLWLILNKLLFQPYLRLLEEREHKTTGAQHDSVDLEHEGAKLKAQFDEKIAQGQAAGYAAKEAINPGCAPAARKDLGPSARRGHPDSGSGQTGSRRRHGTGKAAGRGGSQRRGCRHGAQSSWEESRVSSQDILGIFTIGPGLGRRRR